MRSRCTFLLARQQLPPSPSPPFLSPSLSSLPPPSLPPYLGKSVSARIKSTCCIVGTAVYQVAPWVLREEGEKEGGREGGREGEGNKQAGG